MSIYSLLERVYRQLSRNPPLKMLVGHRIVQLKFPAPWVGHQSEGWICIMGLSMTIHPPPMERGVECQLGARFLCINSSGCVSLVVSDVFRHHRLLSAYVARDLPHPLKLGCLWHEDCCMIAVREIYDCCTIAFHWIETMKAWKFHTLTDQTIRFK